MTPFDLHWELRKVPSNFLGDSNAVKTRVENQRICKISKSKSKIFHLSIQFLIKILLLLRPDHLYGFVRLFWDLSELKLLNEIGVRSTTKTFG